MGALLNAVQQIGGSVGLAVLTAVATARFDAIRPAHPTPAAIASANTSSWAYGFTVSALLLLGAANPRRMAATPQPRPSASRGTDRHRLLGCRVGLRGDGSYPVAGHFEGRKVLELSQSLSGSGKTDVSSAKTLPTFHEADQVLR